MLRKLSELEMEHALERALEPYERIALTDFEQTATMADVTSQFGMDKEYRALGPVKIGITALAFPKRKRRWTLHEELNRAGDKVKWYRIEDAYGTTLAKLKNGETAHMLVAVHNSTVPEGNE